MVVRAKSGSSRGTRSKVASKRTVRIKTLLLRLRPSDSLHGVSADTLGELADILGLPETQVIHEALRKLATELIPSYPADEGPISDRMIEAIKARVPQGAYKSVSSSLF